MNQLEKDLHRQLQRKLELWVSDCFDLYDMAELPPGIAGAATLDILLRVTGKFVAHMTTLPATTAGQVMHDIVETERARAKRAEKEQR